MDMSKTPDLAEDQIEAAAAAEDDHHEDPKSQLRAEIIGFVIAALILATLGGAFLLLGLAGVGLTAVAIVPVLYLMLILLTAGA